MARPCKDPEYLRTHQCNIRLTNIELVYAQQQADIAGLSLSNWLRHSAFSKRALRPKVSPIDRDCYRQMQFMNNNINQIAKQLNSHQYTKIHADIKEVKDFLQIIKNKLIA